MSNEDLKFSVLMPIYIHEKDDEFRMALDSVFNQTLMPNEVLIIADKDIPQNTRDILDEYKAKYPGIFNPIILKEDASLGQARAIGVEMAKYDIVANMDADDIAANDRFEKQMEFMQKNPDIDVLGSWITEFEETPDNIYAIRQLPTTTEEIYKFCKFRCPMNNMTIIYKKKSLLDAGNYSVLQGMEDFELWGRMLSKGYKLANLPECLVNVRAGRNLINRRKGFKVLNYELAVFKKFYQYGYVSKLEYCKAITLKFLLRMIPNWLRGFIYNNFLRKKVG
ncbi:MAG: glycosyltransferase [bacterium]|nr:glycosyltransferase [bacterium]